MSIQYRKYRRICIPFSMLNQDRRSKGCVLLRNMNRQVIQPQIRPTIAVNKFYSSNR